jgi:Domain of unknown function (DUF4159)
LRKAVALLLFFCCLLAVLTPVQSQRRPSRDDFLRPKQFRGELDRKGEFTFARLRYGSYSRREGWDTDYPKADIQFIYGLRNWINSRLEISDDPTAPAPDEKDLFQYPFIYIVEPGYMELSAKDAANLREYLLRGGFLMLDDFWGS